MRRLSATRTITTSTRPAPRAERRAGPGAALVGDGREDDRTLEHGAHWSMTLKNHRMMGRILDRMCNRCHCIPPPAPPLVRQVIAQLRAQITSGEWPVGRRHPARAATGRRAGRGAQHAARGGARARARRAAGAPPGLGDLRGRRTRAVRRGGAPARRRPDRGGDRGAARVRGRGRAAGGATAYRRRSGRPRRRARGPRGGLGQRGCGRLRRGRRRPAHGRGGGRAQPGAGRAVSTLPARRCGRASPARIGPDLSPERYVDHARLVEAIRAGDPDRSAAEAGSYFEPAG